MNNLSLPEFPGKSILQGFLNSEQQLAEIRRPLIQNYFNQLA